MTLYRVQLWDAIFENNRSRQITSMRWVPVPNKHDGESYLKMMDQKNGIALYGCWHLILQVASKCNPRGTLVKGDGTPHDAESIARKSGWRHPDDIQAALDFCSSEIDWLQLVIDETSLERQSGVTHAPPNGMEGRKEGKGKEAPASPNDLTTDEGAEAELKTHESFRSVPSKAIQNTLKIFPKAKWPEAITTLLRCKAGAHIPYPCQSLENFLNGKIQPNRKPTKKPSPEFTGGPVGPSSPQRSPSLQ